MNGSNNVGRVLRPRHSRMIYCDPHTFGVAGSRTVRAKSTFRGEAVPGPRSARAKSIVSSDAIPGPRTTRAKSTIRNETVRANTEVKVKQLAVNILQPAVNVRQPAVNEVQQAAVKIKPEINKDLQMIQKATRLERWESGRSSCVVMHDLFLILQTLQPIDINRFGSIVTNLAIRALDCEFDLFIKFDASDENVQQKQEAAQKLMEVSDKFRDCRIVANNRSPLLKFTHFATGFKCNLEFFRNVDVYKAEILKHLLSFDPRIYDLAFIIKFWMNQNGFISPNGITGYAALWLLFFYLQRGENPVVPATDEFQKRVPPFLVNGTNVAFNYQLEYSTRNNQTIASLLYGFFLYYQRFDFESQVICPALGRTMARIEFERFFNQPINADLNICIQDPFEKQCLLPGKISPEFYRKFRLTMSNAAETCRLKLPGDSITYDCLSVLFAGDANNRNWSTNIADTVNSNHAHNVEVKPIPAQLPVSNAQKRTAVNVTVEPVPRKISIIEIDTVNYNDSNDMSPQHQTNGVEINRCIKREPSVEIVDVDKSTESSAVIIQTNGVNVSRPTVNKEFEERSKSNPVRSIESMKGPGKIANRKPIVVRAESSAANHTNINGANMGSSTTSRECEKQLNTIRVPSTESLMGPGSILNRKSIAARSNVIDKPNGNATSSPMNQKQISVTSDNSLLKRRKTTVNAPLQTNHTDTKMKSNPKSVPNQIVHVPTAVKAEKALQQSKAKDSIRKVVILPKEKDFGLMTSYMREMLNGNDIGIIKEKWAQFSVHFIIDILQRICRTKRRLDDTKSKRLQSNGPFLQTIYIDGLYDVLYQQNQAKRLALHTNSQIEILDISAVNITCHVYTNDTHDMVNIEVYDCGAKNIDVFYDELKHNMANIMSAYFEKVFNYVLFDPCTEILDFSNENPEDYENDLKTLQNEILTDMMTIKHTVNANQLRALDKFLQKWDLPINLEQNILTYRKIWARLCIDFIMDVMTKTFALKLDENNRALQFPNSNYSKSFDVSGVYDVFYRRAQNTIGTNRGGFLFKEMKKTLNSLAEEGERLDKPLRALFHIRTDEQNYGTIYVDIFNLRNKRRSDPITNFRKQFKARVNKLIHAYFEKMMDDCIIFSDEFYLKTLVADNDGIERVKAEAHC